MAQKSWTITHDSLLLVRAEYPPWAEYEPIRLVENPSLTGEKDNPTTYYLSEHDALALVDRLRQAVEWVKSIREGEK